MEKEHEGHKDQKQMWMKFAGMIATSTLVMFILMHQMVYEADHLTFSLNRFIASLVSGSSMVIIMLGFATSSLRLRLLLIGLLLIPLIATMPHRQGVAIALDYLFRRRQRIE